MLIIDSSEKNHTKTAVIKQCESLGIEYETRSLPVGDYLWDDLNLIIERKTVQDFVSSVKSNHLWSQLKSMQDYPEKYLFVSGLWKDLYFKNNKSKFTVAQRIGCLCSVSGHYNVKTIQFDNDTQLIEAIFKIREKAIKHDTSEIIVERVIQHTNPNIRVYLTFDGMGLKKAERLTKIYPNAGVFLQEVSVWGIQDVVELWEIPANTINKTTKEYLGQFFLHKT